VLTQLDRHSEGILAISIDLLVLPRGKVLDASSPLELAENVDVLFMDELAWLCSSQSPLVKRAPGRNAIAFLITAALPAYYRKRSKSCSSALNGY
jgi:hypothetical protein